MKSTINPETGNIDLTGDEGFLTLDQSTPQTVTGNPTINGLLLLEKDLYPEIYATQKTYDASENSFAIKMQWTTSDSDITSGSKIVLNGYPNYAVDLYSTESAGFSYYRNWVQVASFANGVIKFPQLTSNGFLKTSGSDGTLSVDSSSYFVLPSFTAGSVLFSDGSTIAQHNAKFFFNDTTECLGIGTALPTSYLHVIGTTASSGNAVTTATFLGGNGGGASLGIHGGIGSGMSFTSGAGGAGVVAAGPSWLNGGAGGAITFTTGVGGAGISGPASVSGPGGDLTFTTGNAGTLAGGGGTAGRGGNLTLTMGNGGDNSGGAYAGTGGSFYLVSGTGGLASGAGGPGGLISFTSGAGRGATGNAGAGGVFTLTSGVGGVSTSATGGAGGAFTISSGTGGTGGSVGGGGGSFTLAGGNGGTGSGVLGGTGGSFTLAGGVGGGTAAGSCGTGGSLTLYGGAGGAATANNRNGGNGGSFYLYGGAGGAAHGTGIAGTAGNLFLAVTSGGTRTGKVAVGKLSPTAILDLVAGTATANTAPLKFASGTLLTAAEAGAVEFLTDDIYFTITTGMVRKKFALVDPVGGLTSGRVAFATTNGRLTDDSDMTFSGSRLTVTDLTSTNAPIVSSLTAGRVLFAGASKELVDDSDLTFVTDTLTATKMVGTTSVTSASIISTGTITLKGYTVGTLPAGTVGMTAYCTDLLTPTFLTAAVGGGAIVGPVFYNGAAWVSY